MSAADPISTTPLLDAYPGMPSSWQDQGAYIDPNTGRLTVPPNMPSPGVPFTGGGMNSTSPWAYATPGGGGGMGGFGGLSGGMGGMGGRLSPEDAAMATRERTYALGALEGRARDYFNNPLFTGGSQALQGMMSGRDLPYSQGAQNLMFSQAADQIAGAQDAARQRATNRAAASGLGTGGALQNRMANIEGTGAVQRQGALAGIQRQAALGNFNARMQSIGAANQMLGTGYGVTNPLVQQAASARFNTQWGSGIGSDLTGGSGTARGTTAGRGTANFLHRAQNLSYSQRGGYGTGRLFW